MKRTQHIGWIKDYMIAMDRPCTTIEILDYVNCMHTHGLTRKSLCNVMSKNPKEFIRVGSEPRCGNISGTYDIAVWDLIENHI